jgi:hypothetical protein
MIRAKAVFWISALLLALSGCGLLLNNQIGPAAALPTQTVDLFDSNSRRVGYGTLSGGRLDLYNTNSARIGYGVQRGDGSWDFFRTDGSRMGTLTLAIGGGSRLTISPPRRK